MILWHYWSIHTTPLDFLLTCSDLYHSDNYLHERQCGMIYFKLELLNGLGVQSDSRMQTETLLREHEELLWKSEDATGSLTLSLSLPPPPPPPQSP